MIMADVFKILFLILGMLVCTVSYWLMFQALFSRSVDQIREAVLDHPYRVFATGALLGLPLFFIGVALMANGAGPLKFLGGALIVVLTLLSLFGSTGLVRHIGEQLGGDADASRCGRAVIRGGMVVSVACVFPVVGWFFLIPVVLIAGFGAAIRLVWVRRSFHAPVQANEAMQA